ncbi:kynureninase [Saccharospirillum alexandrii]|uniref:kynureninase n=1 Tax=Saccharospirillum alexandrii TaxID=2448477 RepID=UPI000FD92D97|nr:kynureninase [Saccharospirillum alexandrii]
MSLDRSHCLSLDTQDPLAALRDQFEIPDDVLYLDGNSLGARPKAASERARQVIEQEWGQGLIRSWNQAGWIDLPRQVGGQIAALIGAKPEEVVVTDSTSVNLFKVAAAALKQQLATDPSRRVILSEPGNFPTDLYMLQGLSQFMTGGPVLETQPADSLLERIDTDVAVVVLTHVHYKTGKLHDMAAITRRAHEQGALVVWDLSHSGGAVEVDLNGVNADFAIGCGYKYLNGGPGAPGYIFVAERHLAAFEQPLSGWFGHEAPFAMRDDFAPAGDIRRALTGTPSVVATQLLSVGLDTLADTTMAELRAKSVALTQLFIELVETRLPDAGFELVSPRNANERGSQVAFAHPEGYAIMQALIDRGVIGDFRAPDILRFGFAPLYVRFTDVWDSVDCLKDIMDNRTWDQPKYHERHAVT